MNNKEIAQTLREVAIAYQILGENRFRINAYTQAAENIEHLPNDLQQIWKQGNLEDVPGIGKTLAEHLNELFTTGKAKNFEEYIAKMPAGMFDLLKIRSIGPKTAYKLAVILNDKPYDQKKTIYERLQLALDNKVIQDMDGFGKKREEDIFEALKQYNQGTTKKKRMLLSEADAAAYRLTEYMKKDTNMLQIDYLGSMRRRKETIGDLDVSVASKNPVKTVEHFVSYPEVVKIVDQGDKGATVLIYEGIQIDLRVIDQKRYGAMLQYFTGSKYHNIKLREYALSMGLSLSEWGIKDKKTEKIKQFSSEEKFYNYIKLDWIPPELREDHGEVEASREKKLPHLVDVSDMKGDLHMHSDFNYPTSHDLGRSPLEEILKKAVDRGYEYIGLSDHNPKQSGMTENDIVAVTKERKEYFEHLLYDKKLLQKYHQIKKVYMMYEVDIKSDGTVALPEKALDYLDGIIVSLHSSFALEPEKMTKRILKALKFPKVRIFGHPTGRLINEREQVSADWQEVFDECKVRNIALEINASPRRLDLPEGLAKQAIETGCQLTIDTDSHEVTQMDNMPYGIGMARRAWATAHDILNTKSFDDFNKWFMNMK